MIRNTLNFILSFLLLIIASPVYPNDISTSIIKNYTLKISNKFSNTYCNSIRFGISMDGSLRFSIGETIKEFSNNKLNKYVDYELLNKNILLNLENNCEIYDFPEFELEKLVFKY